MPRPKLPAHLKKPRRPEPRAAAKYTGAKESDLVEDGHHGLIRIRCGGGFRVRYAKRRD